MLNLGWAQFHYQLHSNKIKKKTSQIHSLFTYTFLHPWLTSSCPNCNQGMAIAFTFIWPKQNFPHNTCRIYNQLYSKHVKNECGMWDVCLESTAWDNIPVNFFHFRSLNHVPRTWRRATNAAISMPEFVFKSVTFYKMSMCCSGLMSHIWTWSWAMPGMGSSIVLRGVWLSDQKWRTVTGITQCFPNKNLTL